MRILLIIFTISRLTECSNLQYRGVTIGITPYSAPVHSLYHAQNKYGEYTYGYASGLSAKDETKTADGVTRGGYSYIDANGILQTVQYTSDPVNGFRVVATNIPHDLPEVAYARAQHLAAYEYIKAEHALIAASRRYIPAAISPVPVAGTIVVPVHVGGNVLNAIPITTSGAVQHAVSYVPAAVGAAESQYHAQNNLGQYSYGYAGPLSSKGETKTADGITRGGYSYIDANGILQTVQYISDSVNGFRVTATNLPQAPAVKLIGPKVTATVVGPKDNNIGTAGISVVPLSTGNVVAPVVVNTVPIRTTTHIDSTAVEQRPIVGQEDIVQNVNIPIAHTIQSASPYLHPNPNHQTPMITGNPQLGAPFYSGPPQHAIAGQSSPELVLANSPHSLLPNIQNPIFTGPPVLQSAHHQLAYNPEEIPINAIPPYHGQPPLSGSQFPDSDFNLNRPQLHNSNRVILTGPPPNDRHAILNELTLSNGRNQVFINPNSPPPPQAPYEPVAISAIPEIQRELDAPSFDTPTNYRIPFGSAEYQNADTINNGPINQQALNHEVIQQVPVAYQAISYQQQSPQDAADYGKQIELNGASYPQSIPNDGSAPAGHLALFVPDRPAAVQQVQQTPVSSGGDGGGDDGGAGAQVGGEQQALFLRVPPPPPPPQGNEQRWLSAEEQATAPGQGLQAATIEEPRITGPTGYYTTNIEY